MDKQDEFDKKIGVGDILRRERLRQKLTIEDIAQKIHVNKNYLRNLEHNDLQPIPGDVYAIGFARSYAECLGINSDDVVNQLKRDMKSLTFDKPESNSKKMPYLLFFGIFLLICIPCVVIYVVFHFLDFKKPKLVLSQKVVSPVTISSPAHQPTHLIAPLHISGQESIYGDARDVAFVVRAVRPVIVQIINEYNKTIFLKLLHAGDKYRVPKGKYFLRTKDLGALEILTSHDASDKGVPMGANGQSVRKTALSLYVLQKEPVK